eukprot:GDKK01003922.1.p1 GENE.GDKK01003922.1~~GDKK01003922.1.p1  ORF type:complete len:557 (-),score=-10.85 GDKK01003922.1:24-1694(-)
MGQTILLELKPNDAHNTLFAVAQFRSLADGGVVSVGQSWTLEGRGLAKVLSVSCAPGPSEYGMVAGSTRIDVHREATSKQVAGDVPEVVHTLFVGAHGYGKSRSISQSAEETMLPVVKILPSTPTSDIARLVAEATHERVVVTIDDLDTLIGHAQTPAAAYELRSLLKHLMREVKVIASCSTISKIGGLEKEFECVTHLQPPTGLEGRTTVLRTLAGTTSTISDQVITGVAAKCNGFSQADLAKVFQVASSIAFNRTGFVAIEGQDVLAASKLVRPSALQALEVVIPNVRWSDIGGSDEAKRMLQECVDWCLGRQQAIFAHIGLPPPKGVLLYGPPGCSKTMLAKALARESNMNFVSVKGPEVYSKWVGDSEKAVRDVFKQARAAAPCVVFIDELDGMCGHRGAGGVGDRVISQLLTELDGLPAASSSASDSIIFVAATNRPENIDAAVLRPGRIDRKVYVGLPNPAERHSIASLHLGKVPCDDAVSAETVSSRTEGYTGAEVVALCKEAAFQALSRSLKAERIEAADLESAFAKVRPRISKSEVDWYRRWGSEGL